MFKCKYTEKKQREGNRKKKFLARHKIRTTNRLYVNHV